MVNTYTIQSKCIPTSKVATQGSRRKDVGWAVPAALSFVCHYTLCIQCCWSSKSLRGTLRERVQVLFFLHRGKSRCFLYSYSHLRHSNLIFCLYIVLTTPTWKRGHKIIQSIMFMYRDYSIFPPDSSFIQVQLKQGHLNLYKEGKEIDKHLGLRWTEEGKEE